MDKLITVEQLSRAMQLGKLGEQIVIKSKFAFSNASVPPMAAHRPNLPNAPA